MALRFAVFPGRVVRSVPAFTAPSILLFASGLGLGYLGTTSAHVHAAPKVNLPTAAISVAAPPAPQHGNVYFLGHPMSPYQRYTCEKFGPACRIALAIQAAENVEGECEAYHYNSDGTLDWGYFQINSVHLRRRGVSLRDLLDCRANIDFAFQLYTEEGFQPWSTYAGGRYRSFLDDSLVNDEPDLVLRYSAGRLLMPAGLSSR